MKLKMLWKNLLIALALLPGCALPCLGAFDEQLNALGQGGYAEKGQAVEELAATGDERAPAVLEAMLNGRLFTRNRDGKVLIGQQSGEIYILVDPETGAEVDPLPPGEISQVLVNNRVRSTLRAAMSSLNLMSKDSGLRLESAQALYRTPSADNLPLLRKALVRESDPQVKNLIELSIAAIELFNAEDPALKLAAVETLSRDPGLETRNLLQNLLQKNAEGNPQEASPEVRQAAERLLQKIDIKIGFWNAVGHLFRGLSLGSVLLLAAIGLAITFGVMGVINMAHGEMVMIGAYTAYLVQRLFLQNLPAAADWALLLAVPAAFAASGAMGILIERTIIRHLYGRNLETLLATWGVSLILQQLIRSIFGPTNQEVSNPSWMSGSMELAYGQVLTFNRLWIICFSLFVLGIIALILKRSFFGLQMRAVTQNRLMAQSMGTRSGRIDALTFGLGSGIAGMAGVALSQIDNVSPNLGQSYIIDSFMVVVFGGVGNLWGTLIGAFSLGLGNKFLEPYAGAVLGKILILVLIILFIQKYPRGLFALKGRAVEN